MAIHMAMDWHDGEKEMHSLMQVPEQDNPTNSLLSPNAARSLVQYPLIAVGVLDSKKRPWTTVWGGAPGLGQPLGNSIIGIKTLVDRKHDPVVETLFGSNADGELVREEGKGRMVSALTLDLETRRRQKLFGRMVAGAIAEVKEVEDGQPEAGSGSDVEAAHQVQLVCRIDQSLGNCPKYLNKKAIQPAQVKSRLESDSTNLVPDAVKLIRRADLFLVSSTHSEMDMDTNHRGGPAGFVRAQQTSSGTWELYWPEYSGNRLYQTLGNFRDTPQAGLFFGDLETGDALYLTGTTEVLIGSDAAGVLPRSNLAVKFCVTAARFVREALPFRGTPIEDSPYNPKIRLLASEAPVVILGKDTSGSVNTATLMAKERITETIWRYKFSLTNPGTWKAGQWIALDFSSELDIGYSHMRDDDPLSINDDFTRTFTISSPPSPREGRSDDHFEITARTVGTVTGFLSKQRGDGSFETPIRGFGGEVAIEQGEGVITPFVAGGVGITPLLAQLDALDIDRLRIFWTLHIDDIGLAVDVLQTRPEAAKAVRLFFTGIKGEVETDAQASVDQLRQRGTAYELRRLQKEDLLEEDLSNRWHLCVSTRLRQTIEGWLAGKELISEDFNF